MRFNSIHHSYQRATTIHDSNRAVVKHNFDYHVRGHTIFVEDGDEQWNVIEENLICYTMKSHASLGSDMKPASFWMASPTNIWRNNRAVSGGAGRLRPQLPSRSTPHSSLAVRLHQRRLLVRAPGPPQRPELRGQLLPRRHAADPVPQQHGSLERRARPAHLPRLHAHVRRLQLKRDDVAAVLHELHMCVPY